MMISNFDVIAIQDQSDSKFDSEQDTDECKTIGHFQFDPYIEVIIIDDYAYVLSKYSSLHIYDITDKSNPILYKENYIGIINSFVKEGDFLYVVRCPSGLRSKYLDIYDVSDPSNPQVISSTFIAYSVVDISVIDGYFICSNSESITVFNITDRTDPERIYIQYLDSISSFYLSHNILYISQDITSRISVYNLSTPAHPQLICQYFGSDIPTLDSFTPLYLAVYSNYLYVVESFCSLLILNSTDPSNLTYINQIYLENSVSSQTNIHMAGEYFYINAYDCDIEILSKENFTHPTHFGTYPIGASFVAIEGSYLYCINGALTILDISSLGNIQQLSKIGIEGLYNEINDFILMDTLAFCSTSEGILILDLSNFSQPTMVYSKKSYDYINTIELLGEYLFVVGSHTFSVFDISIPSSPTEVASYSSFEVGEVKYELEYICSFVLHGTFGYLLFVSEADEGVLLILDIDKPADIIGLSVYNFGFVPYAFYFGDSCMFVSDNYAYFCFENALRILDIRKKEQPQKISTYSFRDMSPSDIVVESGYAFVGDSESFIILDVHKPKKPKFFHDYISPALSVAVAGQFVAIGTDSLQLYNMVDPHLPILITSFNITKTTAPSGYNSRIQHIVLKDSYALIANGANGFVIVELPVTITGSISAKFGYSILPFGLLVFVPILFLQKHNKRKK